MAAGAGGSCALQCQYVGSNSAVQPFYQQQVGNPVTVEELREVSGWAAHDERRRSKASKQLEAGVIVDSSTRSFDEGADFVRWEHI